MSRSLDPRVWRALSFFIRSREALHSIEWHFCMERLCLASHHGASRHPYRLSLSKIISDLMMVQPGQDRDGDNGAGPLDRAPQAPELPVDLPGGGGLSRWRLQQAAHNGLVAGSSPPGPTTQSCTNPEFPVSAEHSRFSALWGRRNGPLAVSAGNKDRSEADWGPSSHAWEPTLRRLKGKI